MKKILFYRIKNAFTVTKNKHENGHFHVVIKCPIVDPQLNMQVTSHG